MISQNQIDSVDSNVTKFEECYISAANLSHLPLCSLSLMGSDPCSGQFTPAHLSAHLVFDLLCFSLRDCHWRP